MKVAIIHDWLTGFRGGEKVLDSLLKIYPDADLFTLIYTKGKLNERIENRKIYTAFTDRLPFKDTKYRNYLPFFPTAIESFDLRKYDLVLSSSHCVAKGVISSPTALHISYIHSPMRYVWDLYHDYFSEAGSLKSLFIRFVSNYLRIWDVTSAVRVDQFIANSKFIAQRIQKYYGRDSKVIHPPCLTESTEIIQEKKDDFYLIVSALVPYKRIDLAIEAFRINQKRLIVIGSGTEEKKLMKNVPRNVIFLSRVLDSEMIGYYKRAKGFIFPGLEDFGIAPVESQVYCTPVVAFQAGGALETVIDGKTGVFFAKQTVEDLNQAIERLEQIEFKKIDFEINVKRFTEEKFINEIKNQVDTRLEESIQRQKIGYCS